MRRTISPLLLPLVLSACSVMAPTDPYKPVPRVSQHALPAANVQVAEQVKGPLSLGECVDIALANNPEVAAAGKDVEASGAQVESARAGLWPKLNVTGGYTQYMDDIRLVQAEYNNQPGVFASQFLGADLILTIPLYTGGRVTNEISASDLLRQASERKLAFTREELVYNVSSLYYSILAQRHVISSLEFSRDALTEQTKRINEMISYQKAARVDLLRTQVKVADLDQGLTRERNAQAIALRALANLMGLPSTGPDMQVVGDLSEPGDKVDSGKFLVSALDNRQDYLAAKSSLEAQAKRVDAAKSGYLPTVSLKGGYGERRALDVSDRPKPASAQQDNGTTRDVSSIGISFDYAIFDGWLTDAKVREESAKLAAAQDRLRKLALQIRLDVETASLNLESARVRIASTRTAIDQAKESLRIEIMKYELGKGLILDTLDAQTALLQAEVNYYRALADYYTALAKLRFAAGGMS